MTFICIILLLEYMGQIYVEGYFFNKFFFLLLLVGRLTMDKFVTLGALGGLGW